MDLISRKFGNLQTFDRGPPAWKDVQYQLSHAASHPSAAGSESSITLLLTRVSPDLESLVAQMLPADSPFACLAGCCRNPVDRADSSFRDCCGSGSNFAREPGSPDTECLAYPGTNHGHLQYPPGKFLSA